MTDRQLPLHAESDTQKKIEACLDGASYAARRAMSDLKAAADLYGEVTNQSILLSGLSFVAAGLVDSLNGFATGRDGRGWDGCADSGCDAAESNDLPHSEGCVLRYGKADR